MDRSLPSTSTSKCPALDILEKKLYLNNSFMAVAEVKSKLIEFSNFWNSLARISLLNASKEDSEEIVFLLLTLKKNIKYTLSEVGKGRIKKDSDFVCSKCNENIHVPHDEYLWDCLQTHEHAEEMFLKILNSYVSIENSPHQGTEISESVPTLPSIGSELHQNIDNGDSGVEYYEPAANNSDECRNYSSEDEGINTFRFNFTLHYDKLVETKLYPESIMRSVRKMDRIENFTIQKSGPSRAVCLICHCDIISRNRVNKMTIMDHVAGQRHLKNSMILPNLIMLQNYHELFLNLDSEYQAHQVYFAIEKINSLKCILCCQRVPSSKIVDHIMSQLHKNYTIDLFRINNTAYCLMDIQVKLYGITEDPMVKQNFIGNVDEKPPKDKKEKMQKAFKDKKGKSEKQDSDSSHSPETKEEIHNIVKSIEDPRSTNIMDLIPHRYKEHTKFITETQTTLLCSACKQHIVKNIETLRKHLRSSAHQKSSKMVTANYRFFCEICNFTFTDENTWSKHFTDGPNRHVNMAETRKTKATEYECTNCRLIIYGDELSLIRHKTFRSRRDRRLTTEKKEIKLIEAVKKLFRSPDAILTEGLALTKEAKYMLEHNDNTMECCAEIEAALKTVFDFSKAYPFGSRMSGLGNKLSDLDVFIDIGAMFDGEKNQDSYTQVQIVRKAANALCRQKEIFKDVVQIPTARTPIVKLFHGKTQISCDLSFKHGLSVENTKFLRFCIEIQPITQPFILLLKKWSAINQLSEHITTYALAIMAIFYLQVNNYLLSVKKIKELNPSKALVINGWETINYTTPNEMMHNHINTYEHSLHRLLRDFFQYYATFCYNEDVVCPLLGYTIKKNLFHGEQVCLPPEMKSYIQQLSSDDPELFRSLSFFCIQDPFDLSHNLTKACQPHTINKLKTLCELSAKHLSTKEFPY